MSLLLVALCRSGYPPDNFAKLAAVSSHPTSPPVVAVVGATASGKTALALDLAEHLGGEIVNTDSMQVYRGMDIGTAKLPQANGAASSIT